MEEYIVFFIVYYDLHYFTLELCSVKHIGTFKKKRQNKKAREQKQKYKQIKRNIDRKT